MSIFQKILKNEKKLQSEIDSLQKEKSDLEAKINQINSDLEKKQALLDLTLSYKEDIDESQIQKTFQLQAGSDLAKVKKLIEKNRKPLYIKDILKGLGIEDTRNKRSSLGGSLNTYSKEGKIFEKTAPNTFGLIGMKYKDESEEMEERIEISNNNDDFFIESKENGESANPPF